MQNFVREGLTMTLESAFSWIEILIVLSITSIFSLLTFPRLHEWLTYFEARQVQSQYMDAIRLAQQQAQVLNMPVGICGSRDQHSCTKDWSVGYLIFVDKMDDTNANHIDYRINAFSLPLKFGKLHVRSFPVYRDYLSLRPASLFPGDNATLWYCGNNSSRVVFAIRLNQFGQVHVDNLYPAGIKKYPNQSLPC